MGFLDNLGPKWEDLKSDVDRASWCNSEGKGLVNDERYEEAITWFGRAVAYDSTYTEAYRNLGYCYVEVDRREEAENAYRKAAQLEPTNVNILYVWSSTLTQLKKFDEAIVVLQNILQIDSNSVKAYNRLGDLYIKLTFRGRDHLSDAMDAYGKANKLDPQSSDAHWGMGAVSALAGYKDEALEQVRILNQLDPDQADSLMELIQRQS